MLSTLLAIACSWMTTGLTPATEAVRVQGDYIEARTADVFTGPCFANGEVFLTGHQAVMAWKINDGRWNGQDLSGLSVAAAVKGSTTFSMDDPKAAQAVLIVDESASPAQKEALIDLAKTLGGDRLSHVVAVRTSLMNVFVENHDAASASEEEHHVHHGAVEMPQAPRGSFWAPGLAEINTRPLAEGDCICGNEVVQYPPLSRGVSATPAYTLANAFKAEGLNTRWDDRNCRGSFVGHFAY